MRITLIHNPTAGSGRDVEDVIELLTDAGHEVHHRSREDNWQSLLQDPGDLVVAAGGDGTVGDVALAAADRGLPFAALPTGTANNVAKALGLIGDARELVRSWDEGREQRLDIGEVRARAGSLQFLEGVGGGWIPELIARGAEVEDELRLVGRETDRAIALLADLLRKAEPARWGIAVEGTDLSGDYLAVEVLNIRFVGPNVPLAPEADPTDGRLDLALVTEADRDGILEYLDQRLHLASGTLPPLRCVRAQRIRLEVPAGSRVHVDDRAWPEARDLAEPLELEVRCVPGVVAWRGRPIVN